MIIIPVIDLLDGKVVHARGGQRDNYRPVDSVLCKGSDPIDIVRAYLDIYPFESLYIADLNAITRHGDNISLIKQLGKTFPELCIWLDNAVSTPEEVKKFNHDNITIVVGSETKVSPDQMMQLNQEQKEIILSLDFRDNRLLGNLSLLETPGAWPDRVILMNLDRVGSEQGFDNGPAGKLLHNNPHKEWYLAGGICSGAELLALNRKNISGVLMASALHSGRITGRQIRELYNNNI